MPEGPVCARLAARIDQLADRLGTMRFLPHLTLVSGIVVAEAQAGAIAARAAAGIEPFAVRLGGAEGRDEHFRCLFLPAQDGPPLRTAHAIAARAFGRSPDPAFLPHVSLVYGTLTADEKRAIAREIGDGLALAFEVRRLHLWRTEGAVTAWRELGAFAIGVTPLIPSP